MPVTLEKQTQGGLVIAEIRLQSPPLNVLDRTMCTELREILQSVRADDEARIVIVCGAQGEFCSGTDISEHTPEKMPELLPIFHDCLRAINNIDAIVIAAIEGHCLGGGFELALACDRIVADESSVIGLPEIRLGCYPPAGIVQLLARRCYGRAIGLVLSGKPVDPRELQSDGIIDTVVDHGNLDAAVSEEIESYCAMSPSILAIIMRQFHRLGRGNWEQQLLEIEQDYLAEVLSHPDSREGVEAFLGKRPPRWAKRQGLVGPDDVAF
ncbi:MAG TPA: enoyl-CoA hydratase/isomerase family protein [Planctomycetes bacterium]|nr:enoyl-CoA hydratase/isomerase family protein [Planctomycetota bacterium]